MKDLLVTYFEAKAAIHEAFGYKADWVEIPLEDETNQYWMLVGGEDVGGRVVWSPEPLTIAAVRAGEKTYGGTIYTQRFLKKWVYRTPTHVMISVDTHTDGNKFLMVFDGTKECTDGAVADEILAECWEDG